MTGRIPRELRQRYAGTRTMLGVLPVGTRPDSGDGRWLTFYYSLRGDAHRRVRWRRARDAASRCRRAVARARRTHARADRSGAAQSRTLPRRRAATPWRDRTVFIGDAAHGMSPQLGQGVNMALLDAQALATRSRAHADIAAALAHYARARAQPRRDLSALSRWLTPLFQSDATLARAAARRARSAPSAACRSRGREMLKILDRHQTQLVALNA